jgi:hypothetical protein
VGYPFRVLEYWGCSNPEKISSTGSGVRPGRPILRSWTREKIPSSPLRHPFIPFTRIHSIPPRNPFHPYTRFATNPHWGLICGMFQYPLWKFNVLQRLGKRTKGKKPAGQGARQGRRQVPGRGDIQIIPGTACDRGSPGVKPFHLYTFRQNHARRV